MTDPQADLFPDADEPALQAATPPSRRWARLGTVVAWSIILGLVLWATLRETVDRGRPDGDKGALSLLLMRAQAQYVVGAQELFGGLSQPEASNLSSQVRALDTGPVAQRLRYVVLVGELNGPTEAKQYLIRLRQILERHRETVQPTPAEPSILEALDRLYRDYAGLEFAAPSVTTQERHELRERLGWFGDLALAPAGVPGGTKQVAALAGTPAAATLPALEGADPQTRENVLVSARRTTLVFLGSLSFGFLLGLVGFIGLIVMSILLFARKLQPGLRVASGHGGVYAETFAVWLVLFTGFAWAAGVIANERPSLLVGGGAALLSLVALAWPVLRGVPWRQVREDIGLTAGRTPGLEPALGFACYVMTLPLLAVGVIVMIVLMLLTRDAGGGPEDAASFAPNPGPAHPIILDLAFGGWYERLLILILACVIAPLVEETMFRGVLYRHLREVSGRLGAWLSVLLSAAFTSFLFAAVHPQGLLAVPALMALALGFALAREWRGTLVPAMVAHGLNNGLAMLVGMLLFGD